MVTPRISMVAYEDRNRTKAFVAVPNERGRYVFTDRCVVEVPCRACGSMIGEPCKNQNHPESLRYWSGTHGDRRTDASKLNRSLTRAQQAERLAEAPVYPEPGKMDIIYLEQRDAP
jgi:hypothetical protein